MSTAWIERQVEQENRENALGIFAHTIGGLEDMHADFEIRDARGYLIGSGYSAYGWDGEKPIDGWVHDPWAAALEAVREAIAKLRQGPLFVMGVRA